MSANLAKRNILYSVSAQVISLAVSFITGLIVPKFIPEIQYAYWQTYVLYVGYTGVFHFGILDGMVLRFSQYDYENLDKRRIRTHLLFLLCLESLFAFSLFLFSIGMDSYENRRIFAFVAIGLISKNLFTFSSYLLQITNQISRYARLVVSHRVIYGMLVVAILLGRYERFELFCLADLFCDFFATAYCMYLCKDAFWGITESVRDSVKDLKASFASGIKLMIANFSSGLLINSAKMIVQWHWTPLVFAQISFAFSLSSIFLTFISAISVVLFPALKRMDKNEYPDFYVGLRRISSRFLFGVLLLYFPGYFILSLWLPSYLPSLSCWGILLPYIVFSARINLLTNNYLKAYRKEQIMLYVNIIIAVVAICLYAISAYILGNMILILVAVVISIASISMVSESIVGKLIGVSIRKDILMDIVLAVAFFISANLLDLRLGFFIYLFAYAAYFVWDILSGRKKIGMSSNSQ